MPAADFGKLGSDIVTAIDDVREMYAFLAGKDLTTYYEITAAWWSADAGFSDIAESEMLYFPEHSLRELRLAAESCRF